MQLVHLYNMLANRNVGIMLALRSGEFSLVAFATPSRNLQVCFVLLMFGLGLWFGVVGRLVLVFGLWLELVLWLVQELRLCLLLGLRFGFGVRTWVGPWVCPLVRPCVGPWATPWAGNLVAAVVAFPFVVDIAAALFMWIIKQRGVGDYFAHYFAQDLPFVW